jgi:hypothetical protein
MCISGPIEDVNLALAQLIYIPDPRYSGMDTLTVTATDSGNLTSYKYIQISITKTSSIPTIKVIQNLHNMTQNTVASFANFSVINSGGEFFEESNKRPIYSSGYSGPDESSLTAKVSVSHLAQLSIQKMTTSMPHIDQIQVITINTSNATSTPDQFRNSTFQLYLDLSIYGIGMVVTPHIHYGAVGGTADELRATSGQIPLGRGVGESMQSKLEGLLAFKALNITVTVFATPQFLKDIDITLKRAIKWQITFHNADFRLPLLSLTNESATAMSLLHSSTRVGTTDTLILPVTEVVITTYYAYTQLIGGSFLLSLGGFSVPIAHDEQAEDVARALETSTLVTAVAVTRYPLGLDNGYTWTVTFFALTASETGKVALLRADPSGLTGGSGVTTLSSPPFVYTSTPPIVSIMSTQQGVGNPPVYAVRTSASHVNLTIEISLKSTTLNSIEHISLTAVNPFTAESEVLGPFYAATVAMEKEEQLSSNYPPHAQPSGTKNGESVQSLVKGLSFFSTFADNIDVSKVVVSMSGVVTTSWKVTFIDALTANDFFLRYVTH